MDTTCQAVKLDLLALDLDVSMEGGEVGAEELYATTEATNNTGSSSIDALHLFCDTVWREDTHEAEKRHVLIVHRQR